MGTVYVAGVVGLRAIWRNPRLPHVPNRLHEDVLCFSLAKASGRVTASSLIPRQPLPLNRGKVGEGIRLGVGTARFDGRGLLLDLSEEFPDAIGGVSGFRGVTGGGL